ncbi:hypothetical protein BVH03_13620 [Pseudomonas sp. PA15(2017)]|nr:hypothetical protein BVH03_13620 [Pseudomonas sp. PA15(2017)]
MAGIEEGSLAVKSTYRAVAGGVMISKPLAMANYAAASSGFTGRLCPMVTHARNRRLETVG